MPAPGAPHVPAHPARCSRRISPVHAGLAARARARATVARARTGARTCALLAGALDASRVRARAHVAAGATVDGIVVLVHARAAAGVGVRGAAHAVALD